MYNNWPSYNGVKRNKRATGGRGGGGITKDSTKLQLVLPAGNDAVDAAANDVARLAKVSFSSSPSYGRAEEKHDIVEKTTSPVMSTESIQNPLQASQV